MQATDLTQREPEVAKAKSRRSAPVFVPRSDIHETNEAVVLVADLPGVDESTVEVVVDKEVLTIAGQVEPFAPSDYRLSYSEYRSGDFRTQFRLSDAIDPNGISATVKNGVLRLELRKVAAAQSRRIDVKAQ